MLFELIFGVVLIFVDMIPEFDLGLDVSVEALQPVTDAIAYFLPVKAIAACLVIIFALDNAKFLVSVFNFVVRKIPGVN